MQNLSDNELDDIFRKAAQQSAANSDSSQAGWTDMARKLDNADKISGLWKGGVAVVVVMVFLISSGILIWKITSPDKSSEYSSNNSISDTPTNPGIVVIKEGVINTSPQNEPHSNSDFGSLAGKEINKAKDTNGDKSFTVQNSKSVPNESSVEDQETFDGLRANNTAGYKTVDHTGIKKLAIDNQTINNTELAKVAAQDSSISSTNNSEEKLEYVEDAGNRDLSSKPWFAIKLTASPDYSSVGFSSPENSGWNFGGLVEYHFMGRWSIATGLIRARKIYSTSDLVYNGYTADHVSGDCKMWDIPLNLYYHFPSSSKWAFFTGLGFSSYLMSEESYVYTIDTYYGPHDYYQEVSGENNEWFKMLNVSVGIQKHFDRHFSMQFEPFLKAPLAGVGEGDVSLASFGAFLSLKYDFVKR